jgi:hypothetical protein
MTRPSKQRQARGEVCREAPFSDPFGLGDEEGKQTGDPFAYSDLRGDEDLAVPISK